MSSVIILLALIPTAPNPGFEARFYSPQGRATLLQHFDAWSDQALKVSRNLLDGSEVDSNQVVDRLDNPHYKRYRIQRNYRESVSREHLVITFYDSPVSNIITTVDGKMSLLEIVIGLKPTEKAGGYALDRIFTVDAEGRIHQHLQPDADKRQLFNEFVDRIIQTKKPQ